MFEFSRQVKWLLCKKVCTFIYLVFYFFIIYLRCKVDVPENFYAHTAEDAQELARIEQKRKQETLDNQVLKTKAMREAERRQKAMKYSKVSFVSSFRPVCARTYPYDRLW